MRPIFALFLTAALVACHEPVDPELACGSLSQITVFADTDGDGYGTPGTDLVVCEVRDGYATNDDDCDDFRASVHPGAIEQCDGIDNDCDGENDEQLRTRQYYIDADGDGWGDPNLTRGVISCAPPLGYVENNLDCDDTNSAISPDGNEVCDDLDNNCNGRIDDDDLFLDQNSTRQWFLDRDQDSFGDPDDYIRQCAQPPDGRVINDRDCDDSNANIYPGAGEFCNHIDDDCDQLIDDSDTDLDASLQRAWYPDEDLDSAGALYAEPVSDPNNPKPAVPTLACFQPWFHVANSTDCQDTDPRFSDPTEWLVDNDGDTFGSGKPSAPSCFPPDDGQDWVLGLIGTDCDDTSVFVNPLGNEVCNGRDDDCDSFVDDADDDVDPGSTNVWYADFDGDDFGDPAVSQNTCGQPTDYVANNLDCDDSDPDQLANLPWYYDNDGDGVGSGSPSASGCSSPNPKEPWVSSFYGVDCDDTDDTRFPGNEEVCSNGNDEDCDGIDNPCFAPSVEEAYGLFSEEELVPGQGMPSAVERWLEQFRVDESPLLQPGPTSLTKGRLP